VQPLKQRVAHLIDRAGFIVTRKPAASSLERHLRDVFGDLRIDCVIDVGANRGQYGTLLRKGVRFAGRIASVEPATDPFARLRAVSAGDPDWTVQQYALGSEEGMVELRHAATDNFSSLHALNAYGRERFEQNQVGTEPVAIHRLDTVFDELACGARHVFLKCDTQGHDLEVLAGLGDRPEVVGIQIELSFIPIYRGQPDHLAALSSLDERGFVPSGFFPITRDSTTNALIEADGVFVRRP
jgi:FkbM family methyltransferase